MNNLYHSREYSHTFKSFKALLVCKRHDCNAQVWGEKLLSEVPLTHSRKHRRVVEVVGEGGQHPSVVGILVLVLHSRLEGQLWVVGTDDGGRSAATQQLGLVTAQQVNV